MVYGKMTAKAKKAFIQDLPKALEDCPCSHVLNPKLGLLTMKLCQETLAEPRPTP